MLGEASMAKHRELKKKPPANSIAKGHVKLARMAKHAEEKPDRKVRAAKANLQKKIDTRETLVKNRAQAE